MVERHGLCSRSHLPGKGVMNGIYSRFLSIETESYATALKSSRPPVSSI